jgi:hypothetical protein
MLFELLIPIAMLGGQNQQPVAANANPRCTAEPTAVATTLAPDEHWITSLPVAIAVSREDWHGRQLALRDARVEQTGSEGFWIGGPTNCGLFVRPAEGSLIQVRAGDLIDLQGEFRLRARSAERSTTGDDVYVYAYIVRKAPPE